MSTKRYNNKYGVPDGHSGKASAPTGQPVSHRPAGYEYKTVRIPISWSRRRQDRLLNRLAQEGWELVTHHPRGGSFGATIATFRRHRRLGQPETLIDRLVRWLLT